MAQAGEISSFKAKQIVLGPRLRNDSDRTFCDGKLKIPMFYLFLRNLWEFFDA